MEPSNLRAPTAYQRLLKQYEAQGMAYDILTHPYFSTGAFRFTVVNTFTDSNGFIRVVLFCPAGQSVQLFSYQIGSPGGPAGLAVGVPPLAVLATDAETNLEEAHKTNEEDFAIEGISLSFRGWRIAYPDIGAAIFTDGSLHSAIRNGDVTINDVGAQIFPPELTSPLVLSDNGMQAVRGKVSVAPTFNRKVVDHVARFDKFPEGGANSYLMANGEPSTHNYYRLNEGFVWRQSNQKTDKLFSLNVVMEDNCYIVATQPTLFQSSTPADSLGDLEAVWLEFTMWLHGRAFYIPSENI